MALVRSGAKIKGPIRSDPVRSGPVRCGQVQKKAWFGNVQVVAFASQSGSVRYAFCWSGPFYFGSVRRVFWLARSNPFSFPVGTGLERDKMYFVRGSIIYLYCMVCFMNSWRAAVMHGRTVVGPASRSNLYWH